MKNRISLNCPRAALALVFLSGAIAFAQRPAVVSGLTPKQLTDGTAKLVGHSDPGQMLRVVVGLAHPHLAEEEEFLKELGTKGSRNFQRYLTADQWNSRFGPSIEDEQAVVDWAASQGLTVTHRFANRLLVGVEAPVQNVEKAFGVTINNYQLAGKLRFSNDRDPAVPGSLGGIVHSIEGLNNIQQLHPSSSRLSEPEFPVYSAAAGVSTVKEGGSDAVPGLRPQTKAAGGLSPNISNGAYDPTDLYSSQGYDFQALYNQGHCCNPSNNPGITPPETSIAIATAGSQDGNDFQGFHNTYPYLAWHFKEIPVPSGSSPACCDEEGTMDFEWATAMSNSFGAEANTAMVYLYDAADTSFGTFSTMFNQILTDGNARVMSTSWGCRELSCYPQSSMDTDHGIFNAMIGQGWTLVAASGDQGATAGSGAGCFSSLGVQYPSSDPDVVAAGGTTMQLYSNGVFDSQQAWSGGPDGCNTNDGGSTGGVSAYYGTPYYQSGLGYGSRAVPDIALNADWYYTPQNIYFGGQLKTNGGTSIVAPEVAGFFAQANAYMQYVGYVNGGCYGGSVACAPIGNGNNYLYYFGKYPTAAPHSPYYDVTSGCNNNDFTSYYGLGYYCAGTGYDAVTGWGSFNALQLAWAINWYRAGDVGLPYSVFSGPATSHWFNTDQAVSWSTYDTGSSGLPATGVSGFSQAWDSDPGNPLSAAVPGSGNSFYGGPQFPNATTGYLYVSWAGQGCHTANVRSWDNSGYSQDNTYGPVCYDTVAPVTTASFSGAIQSGVYISAVKITLGASDASSGVAATYYSLDGGAYVGYAGPVTVSTAGTHSVSVYSRDAAGNYESAHIYYYTIRAVTKTALFSSLNPSAYGQSVTFTAKISVAFGGAATGTVTFKDGAATLATAGLVLGQATFSTSALHAGSHGMTAVYSGSGTDLGSNSGVLTETVQSTTSATSIGSSANPSTHGKAVTFTASVTSAHGGPVSGTVTFKDGGTIIGTGGVNTATNKASFTISTLAVASHAIRAFYGGSADDAASTSAPLTEVVKQAPTTTTIGSTLNPANYGTAITFTALVTPSPTGAVTGTVTFRDGSTTLASVGVNSATNKATFTTSTLGAGSHSITASYGGTFVFAGSTSGTLTETIKAVATKTVVASSLNPSISGKGVTFTATITPSAAGNVTGTVTFKDGGSTLGTSTVSSNKATFSLSTLSVASHLISATYNGSADYTSSTSAALTEVVNK